jgi:hypothetical protein
MKHLKMIGLAAVAATALSAFFGAGSASATTLEAGGFIQNQSVALTLTLKPQTSMITENTPGNILNTCTGSHIAASTVSPFTAATVTAPVSSLSATGCNNSTTVHKAGTLHIQHIVKTTNGTVSSSGLELTKFSQLFGTYLNCKTGAGTHLGTLTGVASGHATLHVNAWLDCGIIPARWTATYIATSPTGLGVVA